MEPQNISNNSKDVQYEIFSHLDSASLKALGQTDKKMHARVKTWIKETAAGNNVAVENLLKERFTEAQNNFPERQKLFDRIALNYQLCTKLILDTGDPFDGWGILEDQHLNVLVGKLKNLEEFTLNFGINDKPNISEIQLRTLFENSPQLKKVNLPEALLTPTLQDFLKSKSIEMASL